MKILVTTSVFPRWSGDATPPFIYNLCRDLVEAGCRITVIAPHSPGSRFAEVWEGIRIVRFPYFWPLKYQSLFYEGGMIVRLRENPRRILQLPLLCGAQYAANQMLLQEDFDLIHAHSLLPQGWIAGLANSRGLPLVTSSHGSDVFLLKPRWKPVLRHAVRKSTALIANSMATSMRLDELGARPGQVRIIPATTSYPDPTQPDHCPSSPMTLLYAGRLIIEKGPDALVEAMPEILNKFPQCHLHLAGAGNLEASLRDRVAALGLQDKVVFLGWLEPQDLRKEMCKASLLVAPSRVTEGQNLVVTEALSVGCPVAATPRGGMRDLIIHGKTGFVIPDSDQVSIARTVLHSLADRNALSGISRNGFAHFMENYSRERVTSLTLKLYQDCESFN